jgi:hypothetical protein
MCSAVTAEILCTNIFSKQPQEPVHHRISNRTVDNIVVPITCCLLLSWWLKSKGSQNAVPRSAASASPGNQLEMQVLGSTQDLLNQRPWGDPQLSVIPVILKLAQVQGKAESTAEDLFLWQSALITFLLIIYMDQILHPMKKGDNVTGRILWRIW